eukprot:TRINITY_DN29965_c0_g1_i1.p1 TRINITY_DN29965_c0_g1~~TRINITY_DN29965_c0_g1_i1.p1  ORF type:complete len:554 (+),score=93.11 TRINITY_DN29965_c0_g1_i1:62-1723(+)
MAVDREAHWQAADVHDWLAAALQHELHEMQERHQKLIQGMSQHFASSSRAKGIAHSLDDGLEAFELPTKELHIPVGPALIQQTKEMKTVASRDAPAPLQFAPVLPNQAAQSTNEAWTATSSGEERRLSVGSRFSGIISTPSSASRKDPVFKHIRKQEEAWKFNWLEAAKHPYFDAVFSGFILASVVLLAVELQFHGFNTGRRIGYPKYDQPAETLWPNAPAWFEGFEIFLGVIFTLELLVKMVTFRKSFIEDWWNWLDMAIVIAWFIDKVLTASVMPVNPLLLRAVRILRLLRMMKLVRAIQGFDSLFVMTTAIRGSMSVLLWSFILLLLVQVVFAFLLNQIIETWLLDDSVHDEMKLELFQYFGTCSRALLTMFELALANWPPVARLLQEGASEWFIIFSIFHKLTIGFAVIGVINGVFMQETFKVASCDDVIMMRRKKLERKTHESKMFSLFQHADQTGDGVLSFQELTEVLGQPDVALWLQAMELDTSDPALLLKLLDVNTDSYITISELIAGVQRLKGGARSIDVQQVISEMRKLQENVSHLQKAISNS